MANRYSGLLLTGLLTVAALMLFASFMISENSDDSSAVTEYVIQYEGNGADSGTMSIQPRYVGDKRTLTPNAFIRTNHVFDHWNTKADDSGISFEDESDEDISEATGMTDTIKLYAQWKTKTTVILDSNGGLGNSSTVVIYGEPLGEFTNVKKNGYPLVGYTELGSDTVVIGSDGILVSDIEGYSDSEGNWINTDTEVTFYAKWGDPLTYEIDINRKGGDFDRITYATFNSSAITPFENITMVGYILTGYYLPSGEMLIGTDQELVPDIEGYTDPEGKWIRYQDTTVSLDAKWDPIHYDIIFDGNGADSGVMDRLTVEYDTFPNLTLNQFSRIGHSFVSWNEDSEGSGKSWTDGAALTKNLSSEDGSAVTIFAQWKANEYSVLLGQNGGTSNGHATAVYGSNVLKDIQHCTYTGYILTGYYNDRFFTGKLMVDTDGRLQPDTPYTDSEGRWIYEGDVSDGIHARWTPVKYTIVFDGNGSTGGSMLNQQMTYDTSANLNKNQFVREGFWFVCWTDSGGREYKDAAVVKNLSSADGSTVTLRATWTNSPPIYTVSFEGGEGAEGEGPAEMKAEPNTIITMPECTYTKTGYEFYTWEAPFGTYCFAGEEFLVVSDITFTAVWMKLDYYVVYLLDEQLVGEPELYGLGDEVTVNPTEKKTGYDVTAWTTEDAVIVDGKFRMPGKNVILRATSSPHVYTVTLNGNGGPDDGLAKVEYNGGVTEYKGVTRTGYELNGYYIRATSSALKVMSADGKLLSNVDGYTNVEGRWIRSNDCTLFAVWTVEKHTLSIKYSYSDGSEAAADYSKDYSYNEEYEKDSPDITGYTPDIPTVYGKMGLADVNVTVTYCVNGYIITFDTNGGSSIPSMTREYGSALTAPANPVKTDHVFYCWEKDHIRFSFEGATMPAENFTLTAVWSAAPVTSEKGMAIFPDNSNSVVIDKSSSATMTAIDAADTVRVVGSDWIMLMSKGIVTSADGAVNCGAWLLSEKEKEGLPSSVRDKDVFALRMIDSKDSTVDFKGETVTVALPYELKEGQSAEGYCAYFIYGDITGSVDAVYDEETKTMVFETDHFSYWYIDKKSPTASEEDSTAVLIAGIAVALIAAAAIGFVIVRSRLRY